MDRRFKGGCAVLKKLLLPAVKQVGIQAELLTNLRNGLLLDQMKPQNTNFFLGTVVFSLG
jgi:hypothetical protein